MISPDFFFFSGGQQQIQNPLQISKHGSRSVFLSFSDNVLNTRCPTQHLVVAVSRSLFSTRQGPRKEEIVDPPAVRNEVFLVDDDGFRVSRFVDMLVGFFWLFDLLWHFWIVVTTCVFKKGVGADHRPDAQSVNCGNSGVPLHWVFQTHDEAGKKENSRPKTS